MSITHNRKFFLRLFLTLLLTAGAAMSSFECCRAAPGEDLKKSKIKVVAFGDSVTAGTSAKIDLFHDCFQYGTNTVNRVRETQTWRSILNVSSQTGSMALSK